MDETYTHCPNCGVSACHSEIRTERFGKALIYTDCIVTEQFVLKTTYSAMGRPPKRFARNTAIRRCTRRS